MAWVGFVNGFGARGKGVGCMRCARRRWEFICLAESGGQTAPAFQRTEETFQQDAGKDLFFPALDEEKAIELIGMGSTDMEDPSERYIAAERLKFYPSQASTDALLKCVNDRSSTELYDLVARRKSIESLGHFNGEFSREEVVETLVSSLQSSDPYEVEVAVWALSKLGEKTPDVVDAVDAILDRDDVNKRVVIQSLAQMNSKKSVDKISRYLDDDDLATRCSAIGAVYSMSGNDAVMGGICDVLRSNDLNQRRAAIEDITRAKYLPALDRVIETPNSLVLKSRAVREMVGAENRREDLKWSEDLAKKLDILIWDNPRSINLLGTVADTSKARSVQRCVNRLFNNDALQSYLGAKVLLEDHRDNDEAGAQVLDRFNSMEYFDYFAAYHVFKALGWLSYKPAESLLLDNFRTLPPRFFNHKAGACLSLCKMGSESALEDVLKVGKASNIWELKYACLIAAERLGDDRLRRELKDDSDWLIRSRAQTELGFEHLTL